MATLPECYQERLRFKFTDLSVALLLSHVRVSPLQTLLTD